MIAWLKLPHSNLERFSWKHKPQKLQKFQVYILPKRASKDKNISLPTNAALNQLTWPLFRDTPFDKSNFICPMGSSPNLYCTYTAPTCFCCQVPHGLRYHVSPTVLLRYKHRAYQTTWFVQQTVDILNHVSAFLHQDQCMYHTICIHKQKFIYFLISYN